MQCLTNDPQELRDLTAKLPLDGKTSRLDLFLSLEALLVKQVAESRRKETETNLLLVKKLLLAERIKEWIKREGIKVAGAIRVVWHEAKLTVDSVLDDIQTLPFLDPIPTQVTIQRGAVRMRGSSVKKKRVQAAVKAVSAGKLEAKITHERKALQVELKSKSCPVEGIHIWMLTETGDLVGPGLTNPKGKATFESPPGAIFALLIEAPA